MGLSITPLCPWFLFNIKAWWSFPTWTFLHVSPPPYCYIHVLWCLGPAVLPALVARRWLSSSTDLPTDFMVFIQCMMHEIAGPRAAIGMSLATGSGTCMNDRTYMPHQNSLKGMRAASHGSLFGWLWVGTHRALPHYLQVLAEHLVQAEKRYPLVALFVCLIWLLLPLLADNSGWPHVNALVKPLGWADSSAHPVV